MKQDKKKVFNLRLYYFEVQLVLAYTTGVNEFEDKVGVNRTDEDVSAIAGSSAQSSAHLLSLTSQPTVACLQREQLATGTTCAYGPTRTVRC